MSRLAGAQVERPPGKKYASALRFAEIRPPLPVPRAGTLARWREDLADDFELALEAPLGTFRSAAGELRIDDGVHERVVWLRDAVSALRAFALVVRTSAEVTPSKRDRDRLAACLDLLRVDVVTPDIGGGFGVKLVHPWPEDIIVCLAAMRLGRPVRR